MEIRAGKKALEKGQIKRNFEALDADFPAYLRKAMQDIRYVVGKAELSNVSRALTHPLWEAAANALERLPVTVAPPLPEARVLDLMRKQRRDMSVQNAFGNAINALVLDGVPPEQIANQLPGLVLRLADKYAKDQGEDVLARKVANATARSNFLRPADQARYH